jgi:hypothetical protein
VTLQDVLINACGGVLAAFVGSFVISLFRAPVLLDVERAHEIEAVTRDLESARTMLAAPIVPQIEIERRALVEAKLTAFSGPEKAVLHFMLQHGSANWMWLGEKFGEFVASDTISKAFSDGLIECTYPGSQEYCVKSIFLDSLVDYFSKIRPIAPPPA